ncbi:MAG TPA: Hsp20/alpha crystallin family protein [Clostridiaceae bacterium]|mgnify:FL=1|jgi:HSP20 family protein|nr:Hsp20/alpha crystallin family protein [Clostridiaceae bacterium]
MFSLVPFSRKNGNISRRDDWFGIDRFFDEFFRDPFFARVSSWTSPIRADVKETDNEYIVEAEMPGVRKEDIIIDLNNDVLTLGVDVKQERNEDEDGYIYRERRSGSFRRSFTVPNIDNEKVKASYKDGLLTVVLPKAEPEKRARKIEIE